eukprot:scaffold166315_cov14-Prasinocladus_malaysianus.AAC.1
MKCVFCLMTGKHFAVHQNAEKKNKRVGALGCPQLGLSDDVNSLLAAQHTQTSDLKDAVAVGEH